jgi:asparagine N-glycosylation enzyme membrane subunit Stt3
MRKITGAVLILLWVALFTGLAIQFYHVIQVGRLNTRIIRLYQEKTSTPETFPAISDSLQKEITRLLKQRDSFKIPIRVKTMFDRAFFYQLFLFILGILSFLWLLKNRRKRE